MPIALLRELAIQDLPATLTTEDDIDKVRVLRAAGLVVGMISAPANLKPFARVLAITSVGWQALQVGSPAERGLLPPASADPSPATGGTSTTSPHDDQTTA